MATAKREELTHDNNIKISNEAACFVNNKQENTLAKTTGIWHYTHTHTHHAYADKEDTVTDTGTE